MSGTGRVQGMLVLSVALNLFLVGVVVGPLLGGRSLRDDPMRREGPPRFVLERMVADLQPQEAQKLRGIFRDERHSMGQQHGEMRETMKQMAELMKAEKPDVEALRKILGRMRSMGEGMHGNMARAFERIVTELSPESRRLIAAKLAEPFMIPPPPPPPGEEPPVPSPYGGRSH